MEIYRHQTFGIVVRRTGRALNCAMLIIAGSVCSLALTPLC